MHAAWTGARRRAGWIIGAGLLALIGCDDGGSEPGEAPPDAMFEADGTAPPDAGIDAAPDGMPPAADGGPADQGPDADPPPSPACEALVSEVCLLPWPSSHFLTPDESRDTGLRLAPPVEGLPVSSSGVPVDPGLVARSDGFPLGTPIVTLIPHLDVTPLPGEESIERSVAPDSALGLFEVTDDGLRAIPAFAELDAREVDPAARVLFVRPAVILKEDTRYVVALRGLVDLDGAPIAPEPAFAALRDGAAEGPLAARQAAFDDIFAGLDAIGWDRTSLTTAWDFYTASHRSLHGDILHMRSDALQRIGPDGPELSFDAVEQPDPESDPYIAYRVLGTMRVPHYMRPVDGFLNATAYVFNRGPDGMPLADGWRDVPFVLLVPRSAIDGPPQGLIQYGHGLNGSFGQVSSEQHRRTADADGYLYFGLNLVGMSTEDVDNIIGITYDANRFVWLADRLHQGLLESILLGRAMRRVLPTMPQLAEWGVTVDPARSYYEGNSQGGIFGATHVALSLDVTRGMLGVPGQNYSTLLERSVDFTPFFGVLGAAYPRRVDQVLLLALMQVLWDSTDPVSHYGHLIADPYPDNEPNQVILATAKGDWQVALLTAEIVARSGLGVELMEGYDDERTPALIEPVPYPHRGSALINWDYGNPWPPAGNQPPRDELGDPHGKPRRDPDYRRQMVHFFETGEIIDVCGGGPCPPPRDDR